MGDPLWISLFLFIMDNGIILPENKKIDDEIINPVPFIPYIKYPDNKKIFVDTDTEDCTELEFSNDELEEIPEEDWFNLPNNMIYTIGLQRSANVSKMFVKAMTLIARSLGHSVVYFTLDDINYSSDTINSYVYNPSNDNFDIEEISYSNINILDNNKDYIKSDLFNILTEQYNIPYTYQTLGNKYNVYQNIKNIEYVSNYMLDYIRTNNIKDVVEFLKLHKTILMRSLTGNKVKKIVYLDDYTLYINDETEPIFFTNNIYEYLLETLFNSQRDLIQKYLFQQYIESSYNGKCFDIRMHYSRSFNGSWRYVTGYPRYGLFSKIINNKNDNFLICKLKDFLINIYKENKGTELFGQLKSLAYRIAKNIQNLYPEHMINTIGIDFIINNNGNIYILDVNSMPNTNWYHLEHAMMSVQYDLWLASHGNI